MARHVRHIWAKANQHIKVHRHGTRTKNGNDDNIVFIVTAIAVFLWVIL